MVLTASHLYIFSIITLLLTLSRGEVDSYAWNVCWDIPLTDESLFCYGAVRWKMSETVYKEIETRDALAKADYETITNKWIIIDNGEKNPTSD